MFISNKEKAKEIRKALNKEMGLTSKEVSVRSSGSLDIAIKDLTVNKDKVESIAMRYESIHRCEYSGEILSGGNTFVFVEFSTDALAAGAQEHKEKAILCFTEKGHCDDYGVTLAETPKYKAIYWPEARPYAVVRVVKKESNEREEAYIANNAQALATAMAITAGQYGFIF